RLSWQEQLTPAQRAGRPQPHPDPGPSTNAIVCKIYPPGSYIRNEGLLEGVGNMGSSGPFPLTRHSWRVEGGNLRSFDVCSPSLSRLRTKPKCCTPCAHAFPTCATFDGHSRGRRAG